MATTHQARAAASVIVGMLLADISGSAQAQRMKLAETLILTTPDLKPEADLAAFEAHVFTRVAPAWKQTSPGVALHLLRADRGSRKGQHVLAWIADRRQHPHIDDVRLRDDLMPFVTGAGRSVEYHLLSPEEAGTLPEVDVLGVHYIKVRPDQRGAFERFVAERLHPTVGNLRPDLRLLYYKAVRGEDAGSYITVFALTAESRDKYWPKGSDSDAVRAAFKPVQVLAPELSTFLVDGSYLTGDDFAAAVYESREWTDFVRIPPRRD